MLNPVPPTDCMRAREAASVRLDGELSELETLQLEGHLRDCPECSSYAAGIAALTAGLRAEPLEIPTFQVFTPRRRRPAVRLNVAAAAVAITAATASSFAIGQMLGSHGSSPTATVGTTLGASAEQRPEVLGMLRRARPGLMLPSRVIPV